MKKFTTITKDKREGEKTLRVTNFMGGNSFELHSAVDTMKMITASSIFAEPSYYRDGEFTDAKIKDALYRVDSLVAEYSILDDDKYSGKKTSEIMEMVIDDALTEDFGKTLDWAVELRTKYMMRLNPQVIMVRAANHPSRSAWTKENPGKFAEYEEKVMSRADEPAVQTSYQLYRYDGKAKFPGILKRSIASKLSSLDRYHVAKYKNAEIGMIDTARICHASSDVLSELMKTGAVKVSESEKTWENLRSEGKTWMEILKTIRMPHMALLRNLRNIFTEIDDAGHTKEICNELISGVPTGKQFPFRYYTAYKMLEHTDIYHKALVLDALESCMDKSLENMPSLKGKTMVLSDNSGSAWGTCNSEYGTVTVAEIGNLSAVITAMLSDEGYVGVFGDRLEIIPISKRNGVLAQMKTVTEKGKHVGSGTENGIWLFWDKAITSAEHWDNVFIYSDMQAGHGGLYGLNARDYAEYTVHHSYIDVMKLLSKYRSTVYGKINVFSVQTAGYTNVVIPEYCYRSNILYGWTGKEVLFADAIIKMWDSVEADKEKASKQ